MIATLAIFAMATMGEGVTFESLLRDLVDRGQLARLPEPSFALRRTSSAARLDAAAAKGADATSPLARFLRVERHGERELGVMLDAEGPGAVVRIASHSPKGRLLVWIDGAKEPVIDAEMRPLLFGAGAVPRPIAQNAAGGAELVLPIPFAKRCTIACDAPAELEYAIDHRSYAAGTPCTSLTRAEYVGSTRSDGDLDRTARAWMLASKPPSPGEHAFDVTLSEDVPEGSFVATSVEATRGPRAIAEIAFTFESADRDTTSALCRSILRASFDGEETIVCPLVDFLGVATGAPTTVATATAAVTREGRHVARWLMPYRERCELRIENRGARDLHVAGVVRTIPWKWDERSMHLHARWRSDRNDASEGHVLGVEGRGVLAGEVLAQGIVAEPVWSELRIVADGLESVSPTAAFTSDGAIGWTEHPLRALTQGITEWKSHVRVRALDAVPFASTLVLDTSNEPLGSARASTVFFYALPGAKVDVPPITDAMLERRASPPAPK